MTMIREKETDPELQPVRDELATCVDRAERLQERVDELEVRCDNLRRFLGYTREREMSLEREIGDLRKLLWGPK
jgi:chromosome segregation ATPase